MATKKDVAINIDVTDWLKRYQELELDLSTFEKAIAAQQKHGIGSEEMAQLMIVDRLLGNNKEDILTREDKGLLSQGGQANWLGRIARAHIKETLANGQTVSVRAYVGQVHDSDELPEEGETEETPTNGNSNELNGSDMAYVKSEAAAYRAMRFIKKHVVGDIYGRFKIIAINHGDLDEAADYLKAEIDKMVVRLKG